MKKSLLVIISSFLFSFNSLKSEETLYAVKSISNFYMNSSIESPVIYPIDPGKKMTLIKKTYFYGVRSYVENKRKIN